MQVDRTALRADIKSAFPTASLRPASIKDMIAAPYRDNDDAYGLAAVLYGRPWADIPIADLFFHREMLFALSPDAYRVYVPAYLTACLAHDSSLDTYGPDLNEYLLNSVIVEDNAREVYRTTTTARLSVLTPAQRAVMTAVVQYMKERWRERRADEALRQLAAY